MNDWLPTCEDWNSDEPAHARAILKLLSLTHTLFDEHALPEENATEWLPFHNGYGAAAGPF
jgi:hypothetical protein